MDTSQAKHSDWLFDACAFFRVGYALEQLICLIAGVPAKCGSNSSRQARHSAAVREHLAAHDQQKADWILLGHNSDALTGNEVN